MKMYLIDSLNRVAMILTAQTPYDDIIKVFPNNITIDTIKYKYSGLDENKNGIYKEKKGNKNYGYVWNSMRLIEREGLLKHLNVFSSVEQAKFQWSSLDDSIKLQVRAAFDKEK